MSFFQGSGAVCGFLRLYFFIGRELFDSLFAEFDFQGLELDFFAQEVILAVIAHIFLLLFIFGYRSLCGFDFHFLRCDSRFQIGNFRLDSFDAGAQTGNFIFQVLHFQRKLASQRLDFINFRQHGL